MAKVFFQNESRDGAYIIKATQMIQPIKIDTALHTIRKNYPILKRCPCQITTFQDFNLDKDKLASLLDTIDQIDTLQDKEQDIIGRVYEYFLGKFALKESSGKGKGEFYTPKTIVKLIAELIEPLQRYYIRSLLWNRWYVCAVYEIYRKSQWK